MNKNTAVTLAMAGILGGTTATGISKSEPKPPKYPFTEEELSQLAELSGKEKKLFLKQLKEKYGG